MPGNAPLNRRPILLTAFLSAVIVSTSLCFANAMVFHFIQVRHRVRAMTWIWLSHVPLIPFAFLGLRGLGLEKLISFPVQVTLWSGIGFGCLVYLYTNAYFTALASLTVGMLARIAKHGTMSRKQLEEQFPLPRVFEARVAAMVEKGLLVETQHQGDSLFEPTAIARAYGRVFCTVKDFLQWGGGG